MENIDISDRIKGMIVSFLLGDALGTPHELRSNQHNVYTGKLELQARSFNRFTKETTLHPVGCVSDDSEMTLVLLKSLIRNKGYNRSDVLLSYLNWANSDCKHMGKNTRELLKGIKTERGYNNRIKKVLEKSESERSQSNGSLMRCSPLALLSNYYSYSTIDCDITNPNTVNRDTNLVYLTILRCILCDDDTETIIERINTLRSNHKICDEVWDVIINANHVRDVSGKDKGWCLHALHFSIQMLSWSGTYSEAMEYIVNQKGDTDTNMAIASVIIGARMGFNKMMEEDITRENFDIMLNSDYLKTRDSKYTIIDLESFDTLVNLAVDLINNH